MCRRRYRHRLSANVPTNAAAIAAVITATRFVKPNASAEDWEGEPPELQEGSPGVVEFYAGKGRTTCTDLGTAADSALG